MAGISLDAPNADSGGNPPPVGGKNWPSYRLTGVGLVIKAGYYNVNPSRPFDRSTFGEYVVQTTTEGGWMSKGPRWGRRCKLDPGLKAPLVSNFDCEMDTTVLST